MTNMYQYNNLDKEFDMGLTKNTIHKFIICLLMFIVANSYADPNNNVTTQDKWHFEIVPYLWALNMNGRVGAGPVNVHVDENFNDILSHLNGAAMLYLDAHKDRVGLFLNNLYASLSQSSSIKGIINAKATNNYGLFATGISYQVYRKYFSNGCSEQSQITIEPYFGVRYTINDTTLRIAGISSSSNHSWYDPIIGTKIRYDFNRKWLALVSGDVGGTNFNDHNSYNIDGFVGYKPQCHMTNTTLYMGYRLLYQNYVTGSGFNRFNWDMKLFGPLIGLAIEV